VTSPSTTSTSTGTGSTGRGTGKGTGRTLVAGVDSSTQSTKVVVCDARTGAVVAQGRAPHPDGTEVSADAWWDALGVAAAQLPADVLADLVAVAVAGQQHGMVTLDSDGALVRDALLWNDTRSAPAAAQLIDEFGGPAAWADATGSVPVASITATKLRWLADAEAAAAARTAQVLLPHDWLTWRLSGGGPGATGGPGASGVATTTDRGDASGTGYWDPATGSYREDLLRLALRRPSGPLPGLPRVLGPTESPGLTATGSPLGAGLVIGAGTGDNMGAALGLGVRPGDVVVSLGTSGVVSAWHDHPSGDPSGFVAGFADGTGHFLPLVCTLNAARVLSATAALLGTDLAGLTDLALTAPPGAGGLTLLPYLDGERTPNLPDAAGSLHGLRRSTMTPANLARAAVEGMLCGLADGIDALRAQHITVGRVLLIGGAARNAAVQDAAPIVFGTPVTVPADGEYVALGAARQAAWVLSGADEPPDWSAAVETTLAAPADPAPGQALRAAYAAARDALYPSASGRG